MPFGRKQKLGATMWSVGLCVSTVLLALEMLSGDLWVSFNLGLTGIVVGFMLGGPAAKDAIALWRGAPNGDQDVGEAP